MIPRLSIPILEAAAVAGGLWAIVKIAMNLIGAA